MVILPNGHTLIDGNIRTGCYTGDLYFKKGHRNKQWSEQRHFCWI